MGRVTNAVIKFAIKNIDGYSEEQKDVICSAIDKHGPEVTRHFISSENDYKLSADEMREVLKHIDFLRNEAKSLLHLFSLSKAPLLYFSRVYNEVNPIKTYEQTLVQTFYKVACLIQERLSFSGHSNVEVLASLEFAKEKLINPYLKEGFEGDIFPIEALYKIQEACREKVDVLRLLDCKYSPEKMKLLTNAMLKC